MEVDMDISTTKAMDGVTTSTPEAGTSIPLGDITGRGKERRWGGKVEVLLHLPPSLPTNSILEYSADVLMTVSSTDSDPPPLPMTKLHLKLQVQSYIAFKYQADFTLHLIKAGGGGKHHSLEKISS